MKRRGYRMIGGKEYFLDGCITGTTPEDAKEKAHSEARRIRAKGFSVRLIKVVSTQFNIYRTLVTG